jgi:ATP-dependent Lon protease
LPTFVVSKTELIELIRLLIYKTTQPPRYDDKEAADRVATPGVSVGLVWTSVGGEVQFVEATAMVGKGELHLTGQLGDVIRESAQIALTWVCSSILVPLF